MTDRIYKALEEAATDQEILNVLGKEYPDILEKLKKLITILTRRAMIQKWGENHAIEFCTGHPELYDLVISESAVAVNVIWGEVGENDDERTLEICSKLARRLIEIAASRALVAHLLNQIQGAKETPKTFYNLFNLTYTNIQEEVKKRADAPGHTDDGPQQMDVFYDALGPADVAAVYEESFNTICAEILRDATKAREEQERRKKETYIDPLRITEADYLPLLNENLINGLLRLTVGNFEPDERKVTAYYTAPNGIKYQIDQIGEVMGLFDTSAKKILIAGLLYLTEQNYFRGGSANVNPTVLVPLKEYGEVNGRQMTPRKMETKEEQKKENRRIKESVQLFRQNIRRDLTDLEKFSGTMEVTKGENAGEYVTLKIISSHSIKSGIIRINFDIDFARHVVNSYQMQFPPVLFRVSNRKPNTFTIGWKIAFHNSIDSNHAAGTDCTLSVKSLLNEAPEIPTIEELRARKQRNWKDKIKKPLEKSLTELVNEYPILKKWEYRHPKTGQTYTAETAQALTWDVYSLLMIDWIMLKSPQGQLERREKRAAEKAAAAATSAGKKKRGRPRKQPES